MSKTNEQIILKRIQLLTKVGLDMTEEFKSNDFEMVNYGFCNKVKVKWGSYTNMKGINEFHSLKVYFSVMHYAPGTFKM